MSQNSDNETLIQKLLQERDEMYCELSRLRQLEDGSLDKMKTIIEEKDKLISKNEEAVRKNEAIINNKEQQILKLTDRKSVV